MRLSSIEQFRNTVQAIQFKNNFAGLDSQGEPIYEDRTLPTIDFHGTVKLHGTSAAVCYSPKTREFWGQSKERVLENGHMGFYDFMCSNKDMFLALFEEISERQEVIDIVKNIENKVEDLENPHDYVLTLYMEWCGVGVQKSVAISELPKSCYIFGVVLTELNVYNSKTKQFENKRYYLSNRTSQIPERRIYNLEEFETYDITIDFNDLKSAKDTMEELVSNVEKECPVAKSLGISGGCKTGEGIVFTGYWKEDRYCFKIKGEEHKISKTTEKVPDSPEKLNSINEFVEYALTENRFNQGIENVFGKEPWDIKRFGELIRWINIDIQKEETDVLIANNLDYFMVQKSIIQKLKVMFNKYG